MSLSRTLAHLLRDHLVLSRLSCQRVLTGTSGKDEEQPPSRQRSSQRGDTLQIDGLLDDLAEHGRLEEVVACTSCLPAHLQRHSGRTGGGCKETIRLKRGARSDADTDERDDKEGDDR